MSDSAKPAPIPPAPGGSPPRARKKRRRPSRGPSQLTKIVGTLSPPVGWLLLFLIIPLVLVAFVGFATVQSNYLLGFDRLTLDHYAYVLNPASEPLGLLGRSIIISLEATLLSLVIGYAMAYYIARMAAEKWRGILMALVVIPFWVTFIVRIYGLILFVRPNGFFDLGFKALGLPGVGAWVVENLGIGTDFLLVFTLVYVWLPFMVLPLFTALSKVDAQLLEAASDLGASRLRAWWNVTLPLSMPGMITGSIFVFITTLGSFVEPDFLVAAPMIGNFVQTQFGGMQGVGIPLGAAASMFIIVCTMLLVTVYARYAELEESGVFTGTRKTSKLKVRAQAVVLALLVLGLVALAIFEVCGGAVARSANGIADGFLMLAFAVPLAAFVARRRRTAFGFRVTNAESRFARGLVIVLWVLIVWMLVKTATYAYAAGAQGGLTSTDVVLILSFDLIAVLAGILLASAVVVARENPSVFVNGPRSEAFRLLTRGPHPLAVLFRRGSGLLERIAERRGKFALGGLTATMMLVFFVPLLLMAAFSFTAGENPSAWNGFSLRWYIGGQVGVVERDALFKDVKVLGSLGASVIVGLASAFLSLLLGLLAAYAIDRYAFRGKSVLNNAMYLGLVIPSIVMGISISILVRIVNDLFLAPGGITWGFGLSTLIIGHTTFNIPLATLVLLISFREFDRSLEEAAMNLGAGPLTTFFRVTLPNIKAGIVSTLLLTFTFSFDEFPVSLFLAGDNPTYPIVAWGLLSKKIPTPEANAAATLILLISLVFVLLANKIQKGGAIFRI